MYVPSPVLSGELWRYKYTNLGSRSWTLGSDFHFLDDIHSVELMRAYRAIIRLPGREPHPLPDEVAGEGGSLLWHHSSRLDPCAQVIEVVDDTPPDTVVWGPGLGVAPVVQGLAGSGQVFCRLDYCDVAVEHAKYWASSSHGAKDNLGVAVTSSAVGRLFA